MHGGWVLFGALVLLVAAPTASAWLGPESDDGWPINVDGVELRPPVGPAIAADPLNKAGPFTAYPYYPLLTAELQRLALDHPDLVRLTSAGTSVAGLDIWMLEIADFANLEAGVGVPLEDREVVYIDGGTHSNEYSGVYFVTEVAQFLLDEYGTNETATWIVENRHTFLVPMVNPDGSNAMGRLNANLVNINRNYPVLWNAIDESPVLNNPGPAPASEPETQVVVGLIESLEPDYLATIHCCGNLWLYPYGVEGIDPVDNATFAAVCDAVFADVREDCGPIWSTIYPASGSTVDTAYEYAGSFAWGFEMSGRGAVALWGQPVTTGDVREQERESWNGVMHAFLNVERYGAHPVLERVVGDGGGLVVTVTNDGLGPLEAGTVTVGEATAQLPRLEPGETAQVVVRGDFAPGPVEASFEYQKRIMDAPTGTRTVTTALETLGDGLVGPGESGLLPDLSAASTDLDGRDTPGPGVLAATLAFALTAVAAGVRWRR